MFEHMNLKEIILNTCQRDTIHISSGFTFIGHASGQNRKMCTYQDFDVIMVKKACFPYQLQITVNASFAVALLKLKRN